MENTISSVQENSERQKKKGLIAVRNWMKVDIKNTQI